MSQPNARHDPADVGYGDDDAYRPRKPKSTRTVRFWVLPTLVTLVLMSALSAFYLGGVLQPMTNLRHFPVAIINEDAGPTGAQVVKGLLAGFDHDAYDVRVLNPDQAKKQLDTGEIYGVAVIPPNFSSKLQAYVKSALTPGRVEPAVIVISTNPRAGTVGASIAGQSLQREITQIDQRVGQRLSQEVAAQTGKKPEPGAVALILANPVEVRSTVHSALPDGTANGLSAFYFALLLVLAGFVGSVAVSIAATKTSGVARFRSLLIMWVMMVAVALLTAAAFVTVGANLGMPLQNTLELWLFSSLSILAVGVASTSLIAIMGRTGVLVGLFVFVVLGLPAAGGAVPLQATPEWFEWSAKFQPLYQVFVGARSLLYFDGRADAGLTQSLAWSTAGMLIGALLGAVVTLLADLRRRRRAVPVETGPEAAAVDAGVLQPEQ